jgi:ferredoxin-NADP reductase
VHEGDVLEIKAPAGQFFLDPDPQVPAVLVCGGIGITPMMSMLRWCLDEQPDRPVYLYYGLRHSGEQAFKQTLEQLAGSHPNFHLNVLYSRPGPGDVQGRDFQSTGHVDIDLLRRTLPHGRHQFYVCGPPAMMESLVPALHAWGVLAEDIHHEAFGPASMRSALGALPDTALSHSAPVDVTFRRSGRTLAWNGQDASLLDFAERHGVVVESGCRSGSCGSCETKLVSGTVRYAQKPDHDVAPGSCLLCIGTPSSPLVIEA